VTYYQGLRENILCGKRKNAMKQIYFIGIDISKGKIDVALMNHQGQVLLEKVIGNEKVKLANTLSSILRKHKIMVDEVLFCCEATGVYTNPLKQAVIQQGWTLWVENAYKIKKASLDMRGKTDQKDARRIAEYAMRYKDRQKKYTAPDQTQEQLHALLGARETMIDQSVRLKQQLSESKKHDPDKYKILKACFSPTLKLLAKETKRIEIQINELTAQNESVSRNVKLLTSIPGIGLQNALNFIVTSRNFTLFENANQLSCYAGVVPFPSQSGLMQKRDRVSQFANKKLKKLIHMAAISATRVKGEIRDYYLRKVKQGKNKMSVLNAIRCKLIKRMFAVIERQTPYLPTPEHIFSSN
jgi:transposase